MIRRKKKAKVKKADRLGGELAQIGRENESLRIKNAWLENELTRLGLNGREAISKP